MKSPTAVAAYQLEMEVWLRQGWLELTEYSKQHRGQRVLVWDRVEGVCAAVYQDAVGWASRPVSFRSSPLVLTSVVCWRPLPETPASV